MRYLTQRNKVKNIFTLNASTQCFDVQTININQLQLSRTRNYYFSKQILLLHTKQHLQDYTDFVKNKNGKSQSANFTLYSIKALTVHFTVACFSGLVLLSFQPAPNAFKIFSDTVAFNASVNRHTYRCLMLIVM